MIQFEEDIVRYLNNWTHDSCLIVNTESCLKLRCQQLGHLISSEAAGVGGKP